MTFTQDDLRVGMKVKIRNDIDSPDKGKELTVAGFTLGHACFKESLRLYNLEAIKCIVEDKKTVDGIEALVEMKKGKYAQCTVNKSDSNNIFVFRLKDKEKLEGVYKINAKKFGHCGWSVNEFIKNRYEILEELPEWAKPHPFKIGDIIAHRYPPSDANESHAREVLELDGEWLKIRDANLKVWDGLYENYRQATSEERAQFFEEAYKNLKRGD